jgi:uncharacterized integral membrane protein
MGYKYVFVAVLASAITMFALQNGAPVSIRLLIWGLPEVPLAGVILVSVAAGIVLAGVPLWVERWRLRARVRSLETRLTAAEALHGEHDRGPTSPPSRG